MKLAAMVARSLQAGMQAELRDIERAVAGSTRDAGRGLRTELRRQVASAGLGQRLANSWRDKHYPNQKLDAASLVYTKAPQIIRAFDEIVLIRSKRGRFLATPFRRPRPTSLPGDRPVSGRHTSDTLPIDLNSAPLSIGRHVSGIADPFNGHIDAFRISHVQRSDGWIETTWNNLSDPGAFAAAAAEEPPPPAGAGVVVCLMG